LIAAVTGGGGFIGRRLVARLRGEGHEVRLLKRADAELGRDGPDRFAPLLGGADLLFHCAGEVRDGSRMHAVHVQGTRDLLDAATGRVGRIVHLSSAGAYGPVRDGVIDETRPLRPVGPYEETKARADEMVAESPIPSAVLRPSIVFAEDMPNDSLRQLAGAIRRGLFFFVGAPGASANYVHADDVAEALLLLGRLDVGGAFNLSDWTTIEAFAAALARGIGAREPRRRLPESVARAAAGAGRVLPRFPLTASRIDGLTNRARYSSARLEGLGFAFARPLEAAVEATAEAWR